MIVEESCREGEAAAHVVERVVANHVELLEGQAPHGSLLVLRSHDSVEAGLYRVDAAQCATDGTQDVTIPALPPQHHVLAAGLPEAAHEHERRQQAQERDRSYNGKRKGEFFGSELRHGAASYTRPMRPDEVKTLLSGIENGSTTVEEAYRALSDLPVEDVDFAQVDTHRELRQGMPEAIYAQGKTTEQVARIAEVLLERNSGAVIATRVSSEMAQSLTESFPASRDHRDARVVVFRGDTRNRLGRVAVVAAGTSDLPVAEEAAVVAVAAGAEVIRITDVGVAGLHRLLAQQRQLHEAQVVIVIAGMEGALASLVGGIVAAPVVAVPTSVGYGASFDGLAALLAMLNSCAAGVAVMNIDNGFGAAMFALRLLRTMAR